MILARARFEAATSGGSVFLSGDFNRQVIFNIYSLDDCIQYCHSSSNGKDDSAYRIITGVSSPVSISDDFLKRYEVPEDKLPAFRMIDARTKTSSLNISGNFATYTSFKNPENSSSETGRIDFIFGGNNEGWLVLHLGCL